MFGDNIPENNAFKTDVNYWLSEATRLKIAAELCWSTDENIQRSAQQAKVFNVEQTLLNDAADADSELKWLFVNLMAFSIQHLAIAILVNNNPARFYANPPGYRIVELILECGVSLNEAQHNILLNIENGFKWSERSDWNVKLNTKEIHSLIRRVGTSEDIDISKKNELEELYEIINTKAGELLSTGELKN